MHWLQSLWRSTLDGLAALARTFLLITLVVTIMLRTRNPWPQDEAPKPEPRENECFAPGEHRRPDGTLCGYIAPPGATCNKCGGRAPRETTS